MLPKRKRHACMLVSAGAAPGRLRESREVLAWLPRLRNECFIEWQKLASVYMCASYVLGLDWTNCTSAAGANVWWRAK